MGNTSTKWMTLYRQAMKSHQAEIEKLNREHEAELLQEQVKNKWLSNKLIDAQRQLRTATFELMRKEEEISGLRQQLRRTQKLGRGFKKKASVQTSVASSDERGNRNRA